MFPDPCGWKFIGFTAFLYDMNRISLDMDVKRF